MITLLTTLFILSILVWIKNFKRAKNEDMESIIMDDFIWYFVSVLTALYSAGLIMYIMITYLP